MKRAKYLSSLRPAILLSICVFMLTIFLLPNNALCEDKNIVVINAKKLDGPVIVPDMDFGEPGSSPWWVTGINLTDTSDTIFRKDIYTAIEADFKGRCMSYWGFIQYLLNQMISVK